MTHRDRPSDRNGGLPQSCGRGFSGRAMLVDGARGSRCPAPPRHATPSAPNRKPLAKILGEAVSMSHYQRSLVYDHWSLISDC